MTANEISGLKKEAGFNKHIPPQYEEAILIVLKAYPELKQIPITFKLKNLHPVPYGTTPTLGSLFKPANKRVYTITILEKDRDPGRSVLFKNLPPAYKQ